MPRSACQELYRDDRKSPVNQMSITRKRMIASRLIMIGRRQNFEGEVVR